MEPVVLLTTGPSLCAGVLVDELGTVATAYHCVASGRRPMVTTRDGSEGIGRTIATDPENDLALVEVPELAGRAYMELRTEPLALGETVWALGHPYGSQASTSRSMEGMLRWSASRGVVSAVGPSLVQVDAALNPGNSGGPLVDDHGMLAGIASRKLRADNVGFVVPASELAELMELREPARPTGGQLSVGVPAYLPRLDAPLALGVSAQLSLRDTLLLTGAAYLPVGGHWVAFDRGSTEWVSGEFTIGVRGRLGRGRWSTTLDLGAGVGVLNGEQVNVDGEQLDILPLFFPPVPLAYGRLATGGAGFRCVWLPSKGLLFAVDVDFPGTITAF